MSVYRFIWIGCGILGLIATTLKYNIAVDLEENGIRRQLNVTNKYCNPKSSSSVYFLFKGKEYFVKTNSTKCSEIGQTIELVYHSKNDSFYIPDSLESYKRHIYLAILFFISAFLPYEWIKKKMEPKASNA